MDCFFSKYSSDKMDKEANTDLCSDLDDRITVVLRLINWTFWEGGTQTIDKIPNIISKKNLLTSG